MLHAYMISVHKLSKISTFVHIKFRKKKKTKIKNHHINYCLGSGWCTDSEKKITLTLFKQQELVAKEVEKRQTIIKR